MTFAASHFTLEALRKASWLPLHILSRRCTAGGVAWNVDFGYAPVDPEVRRLTTAAAERFQAFGGAVEAVNPDWDNPREPASVMWYVSYAAHLGERYDQRAEWFEPSLVEMIEAGRRILGVQHGQAQLARTVFYEQARRSSSPTICS